MTALPVAGAMLDVGGGSPAQGAGGLPTCDNKVAILESQPGWTGADDGAGAGVVDGGAGKNTLVRR